ncbi:Arc family DNA-binding protein [Pseudomonas syringae group genomosp. 3]|uniref:Arc family DNA-binding protein n=1 Tax=Pseudomonas syringae group genomosp. 3 TaxID=251701 RepID=UPI000A55CA37|nr:Arc family DNA-binding protein [Pseudomonas syringae group genomosp. 3]
MQRYEGGSRGADKFVVRFPDDMRSEVESAAASSDTSMNTVVIRALRLYLHGQERQELLLDALTKASRDAGIRGAEAQIRRIADSVDPRCLFIRLNPAGARVDELEKDSGGFIDARTRADYLLFLAGFRAAQEQQA